MNKYNLELTGFELTELMHIVGSCNKYSIAEYDRGQGTVARELYNKMKALRESNEASILGQHPIG